MQGRLSSSSGGLDGVNAPPLHRINTSSSRDAYDSGYSSFSIPHTSQSMEYPSQQAQSQQHSMLHHSSSGIGVYDSGLREQHQQQQQHHLRIPRGGSHSGGGSSSDRLVSNQRITSGGSSDRLHIPRGGSHSGSTDRLPSYSSGVDELSSQFTEGLSLHSSSREFEVPLSGAPHSPSPPQLGHLSQLSQQQQASSLHSGVRRASSSSAAAGGIGSGSSREWGGLMDMMSVPGGMLDSTQQQHQQHQQSAASASPLTGAVSGSSSSYNAQQQRPPGGW
jgi:hypothetical protein